MFAAKVEHLLGFGDAANGRAGQAMATHDQAECRDSKRFLRCADEGDIAVPTKQIDIGVDVVIGGNCVEDEVEAAGVLFHLVGIAGDDDFVRTQAQRVVLLVGRSGKDDRVGPERMGKFYRHVAKAAQTDHANFLALGDTPVAHRRVSCYACAEKRPGPGEFEVAGDAQNEVFIDDDAIGISAIGDTSKVLVRSVVGEHQVRAKLLQAGLALWARAVGIDQAADGSKVARFIFIDFRADLGDTPDDFMARDDRVNSGHDAAPFVTNLVEVGVADATEKDFYLDIVFSRTASRNRGGSQPRCGTGSGISFRVVRHHIYILPPIGRTFSQRHNFSISSSGFQRLQLVRCGSLIPFAPFTLLLAASSQLSTSPVLFVGNVFHPVHRLAVQRFLNGDMRHRGRRGRAMPMLLTGRKPDHIARPNFLDRTALTLRPAESGGDDQRLTEWMRMPGSARTRLERDACATNTRRFGWLE